MKEIYIPSNVTSMGINAFGSATSDVTITVENPASVMTLGTDWSGQAKVIFGAEPVATE